MVRFLTTLGRGNGKCDCFGQKSCPLTDTPSNGPWIDIRATTIDQSSPLCKVWIENVPTQAFLALLAHSWRRKGHDREPKTKNEVKLSAIKTKWIKRQDSDLSRLAQGRRLALVAADSLFSICRRRRQNLIVWAPSSPDNWTNTYSSYSTKNDERESSAHPLNPRIQERERQ